MQIWSLGETSRGQINSGDEVPGQDIGKCFQGEPQEWTYFEGIAACCLRPVEFLVAPLRFPISMTKGFWASWRGLRGGGERACMGGIPDPRGWVVGFVHFPEEPLFGSSLWYPHRRPRWDGTLWVLPFVGRPPNPGPSPLFARQVWFQNRRMVDKRQSG